MSGIIRGRTTRAGSISRRFSDLLDRCGGWSPPSGPPTPRRRHVLVVDDDPDARYFVSRALLRAGYSVVTARDGDEALEVLRGCPVPVIVSDLRVSRCFGRQVGIARQDPANLVEAVERAWPESSTI